MIRILLVAMMLVSIGCGNIECPKHDNEKVNRALKVKCYRDKMIERTKFFENNPVIKKRGK